jgi:hypothetical protein
MIDDRDGASQCSGLLKSMILDGETEANEGNDCL